MTPPHHGATIAFAIALLGTGCATTPSRNPDHEALVEAERAFARHAEASDVRTAFLAAFADDGILMTPAPKRLKDHYTARPAPADPRAMRLQWAPVASGIAASGDFGFTSGPSTMTMRDGSRPPRHGAYFSVWKRERGRWRVVLDAGVTSPSPIAPAGLLPSALVPPKPSDLNAGGLEAITSTERGTTWDARALSAALARDARLYLDGMAPVTGEAAILAALADTLPLTLTPTGGDVAASGDLGFTYGTWSTGTATGYYVHLWTRGAQGSWRIAVAIRLGAA